MKKAKPRKVRITFTATVYQSISVRMTQADIAKALRRKLSPEWSRIVHSPKSITIEELERDK